jgi:hypothetical protein
VILMFVRFGSRPSRDSQDLQMNLLCAY